MPIINFMNPITLLVGVILFVLVSYLGKKTKKSWIVILISFFIYLWIDDIEAKMGKRKSIDNSMDWFWRNV